MTQNTHIKCKNETTGCCQSVVAADAVDTAAGMAAESLKRPTAKPVSCRKIQGKRRQSEVGGRIKAAGDANAGTSRGGGTLPTGMNTGLAAWRAMVRDVSDMLVNLRHMALRQGEGRLADACAPLIVELMDVQARLSVAGLELTGQAAGKSGGDRAASAGGGSEKAQGKRRVTGNPLTVREKECLRWCAAGKTYWETALILGIAERTVDFHMQSARRKLDAESNAACVAKALLLGLL